MDTPIGDVYVPPRGDKNDPVLAFVGEAPGEKEVEERKPFVGRAGKLLVSAVEEAYKTAFKETSAPNAFMERHYITNVSKYRPNKNDFKTAFYERNKPTKKLLEFRKALREEILEVQPKVVVALGEEAVKALVPRTMPAGITDYHGSVVRDALPMPVVATVHPAAVLRNWPLFPFLVHDISKALSIARNGLDPLPEIVVCDTMQKVDMLIDELKNADKTAFDVETENRQISCISFCFNTERTYCIPFWFGNSGSFFSIDEETRIWSGLAGLFNDETKTFIAHNALFDIQAVAPLTGGVLKARIFDTMLAFHTLNLELPARIESICSMYTHLEYYKFLRKTDSMHKFFEYNALDSYVAYKSALGLERDLDEAGLRPFFDEYVAPLPKAFAAIELRGLKVDKDKMREAREALSKRKEETAEEARRIVGVQDLNLNSPKQLGEVLYGKLGFKPVYKKRQKGKKTVTTDAEALSELKAKYDHPFLDKLLEYRRIDKLVSTYLDVKLDPDGRLRCSYNLAGTCTGRVSSSKTVYGTGTNLQNLPNNEIRSIITADEGKTLVNIDLSQAEARVVAYISGEERLIRVFDEGGDIHRRNASKIFGKNEDDVTEEERNLAKRTVHGANYGMGPITFAKNVGVPTAKARELLNRYFTTFPRVALWQNTIKRLLNTERYLRTPLGRDRYFTSGWSSSMLKEGLAYIPQSVVADILNRFLVMLVGKGYDVLLQVHDSVLLQVDDDKVDDEIRTIANMYDENFRIPCRDMVEGRTRIMYIPIDFKTGKNFYEMSKVRLDTAC